MKAVRDFQHVVEKQDTVWIPMRDGTRLAASLWLPASARDRPVPAVLEYIPYRRRDFTAARDALNHPYFAGHGYAALRVDMRGSGDSEGILHDEYLPQEQEDGLDVIDWIAAQDWCDGHVGMIGISWGGFNGLQIAAHRPEALKAVIAVASSDDRYADDIHHMGGCLLGDSLSWASVMFAYNSLPPDPDVAGEGWREAWLERLEHNDSWLDIWLRHQRRDGYWRQASICEDYASVRCPVMLVSGWADGYSNAVFRMLENLQAPRKALVGPWSHRYPHMGLPGPAIGFLQECVRWWDRWLKGERNGTDEEPQLRIWMQDSVTPTTSYQMRPGRWVAEEAWPSSRVAELCLPLGPHRIGREGEETRPADLTIQSPLSTGLFAGKWCSYGGAPDLAHDQRREDGGALVFDSDPLDEPMEILGAARVILRFSSDRPVAMVAARLSDVRPNGEATRVTYGLLNLTRIESERHPVLLVPGETYEATVNLNEAAHSFPAGHRLRLSLSTSYWPLAWAPPEPVMLTVHGTGSALVLPVRAARPEDANLRPLGEPEGAPPLERAMLEPEHHDWRVISELASDWLTLEVTDDRGRFRIEPIGLEARSHTREWYSCRGNDFLSLCGRTQATRELARGDWHIRTCTETAMTSTADEFVVHTDLDAFENDRRIFCRSRHHRIPRDLL